MAKLDAVAAYVLPVKPHDLAPPAPSEDEQGCRFGSERTHGVFALAFFGENPAKSPEFFVCQKPLARTVAVGSDDTAGIGVFEPVAPVLGFVEH